MNFLQKKLYQAANVLYNYKFCKDNLRLTVNKDGIKNLKPPFVALAVHKSVLDAQIVARTLAPTPMAFVTAYDQIARHGYYKHIGAVPKRQFVAEISAVRQMKKLIERRVPVVIFPEGKLSVDGTNGVITYNTAKVVKYLGEQVVAVQIDGAYLNKPRWAQTRRNSQIFVNAEVILTKEELKNLSVEKVYDKIIGKLAYNEYKWQRENKFVMDVNPADGLHKILYKCPACCGEFAMASRQDRLYCKQCGASWQMDEFGVITEAAGANKTEHKCAYVHLDKQNQVTSSHMNTFDSVPEWYDWQRQTVKEQLSKDEFRLDFECRVYELPTLKGYKDLGEGRFSFDNGGITLTVDGSKHFYPPTAFNTIAFDAEELFYISQPSNTFKIIPLGDNGKYITKLNLAVEENYKINRIKKENCPL